MPSIETRLLLLLVVVFLALNTILLRLSCRLANYAGRWLPHGTLLKIPTYRTCLVIVVGVVVIFGLIAAASEFLIGSWAADLFQQRTWNALVYVFECLLVIKLIDWGLSDEQPVPTRLVTVASLVHVFLVIAVCLGTGQVFAGLISR